MRNRNHATKMHRWEQTPMEQKCMRCFVIRRMKTGIQFNQRNLNTQKAFEYSSDRTTWTEIVPECNKPTNHE